MTKYKKSHHLIFSWWKFVTKEKQQQRRREEGLKKKKEKTEPRSAFSKNGALCHIWTRPQSTVIWCVLLFFLQHPQHFLHWRWIQWADFFFFLFVEIALRNKDLRGNATRVQHVSLRQHESILQRIAEHACVRYIIQGRKKIHFFLSTSHTSTTDAAWVTKTTP